ncbi:MAG TPA: hypothetical protein VKU91_04655 [Acidimicrobiales bacterium]|nr:hypothetical protein [Acidimicrobiales bacterium]
MLFFLLSVFIGGLIIGALGRLVVPGPNPMGILATAGVGIISAILGWVIARAIWVFPARHEVLTVIIEVLVAAAIVSLFTRGRRSMPYRR